MNQATINRVNGMLEELGTTKALRDEAWARVFAETRNSRVRLVKQAERLSNEADDLMVEIGRVVNGAR